MPSAQGDSRNAEKIGGDAGGSRRVSWGMIFLGATLLAFALFLYLYAARNRPEIKSESSNLSNIDRTPPRAGTENSETTPSPQTSQPQKSLNRNRSTNAGR